MIGCISAEHKHIKAMPRAAAAAADDDVDADEQRLDMRAADLAQSTKSVTRPRVMFHHCFILPPLSSEPASPLKTSATKSAAHQNENMPGIMHSC
jgi:hypothetical protein